MKIVPNLSLAPGEDERALYKLAAKKLDIRPGDIEELTIRRRSLDARRKGAVKYVCTVAVRAKGEPAEPEDTYNIPSVTPRGAPPVIAGFGPAGMFCALTPRPRGAAAHSPRARPGRRRAHGQGGRLQGAAARWTTECNVQFGEARRPGHFPTENLNNRHA